MSRKKKRKGKWGVVGSVWESRKNILQKQRRKEMKVVVTSPNGAVIGNASPKEEEISGPSHWETEDKMESIKDCSLAPDKKAIYISPLVYKKIKALMNKYDSREWLAYLIGKDDHVSDIYFPKQRATSATVDNVELSATIKNIIGVMHSHHSMGNSFSGTDHEYINDNHNISILVSHKEITGQYRFITPCNRYKIIPINVQVYYDINFDEEAFIKEADEKMSSPIPTGRWHGTYPEYPEHRFSRAEEDAQRSTMPNDEDIEKALEELNFEDDAILAEQFEDDKSLDDEFDEFEDSLVEDMAKLGEVTIYDE